MKALILAESGDLLWQFVRQLEELGFGSVNAADEWQGFMKAVVAEKPQLVLLSIRSLRMAGEEATKPLEWTLRALELPVVILVEPGEEMARYALEAQSDYDHYLSVPTDVRDLYARLGPLLNAPGLREPDPDGQPGQSVEELPWRDELSAEIGDDMGGIDDLDAFIDFPITDSVPQLSDPGVDESATTSIDPADGASTPANAPVPGSVDSEAVFNDATSRSSTSRGHRTMDNPVVPESLVHSDPVASPVEPTRLGVHGSDDGEQRMPTLADQQTDWTEGDFLLDAPEPDLGHLGGDFLLDAPEPDLRPHEDARSVERQVTPPAPVSDSSPVPSEPRQMDAVVEETAERQTVNITLSGIRAGLISGIRIPKVLFGLVSNRATGRLRLTQDALQREVIFYRGTIGQVTNDPSLADVDRLLSTFAWETGSYLFDDEPVDARTFESFGDSMELIWRGIESRLSVDNVMLPLTRHFRSYPVQTTAVRMLGQSELLAPVRAALERLHSDRTLEQAIVNTGEAPDRSLRIAYFGWMCGALVFREAPNREMLVVEYITDFHSADVEQTENVRRLTDTMRRSRRSVPFTNLQISGNGPGSQSKEPSEPPHVKEARLQLESLLHQLTTRPPLQAMGLRDGCGLSEVTSRYYELARQYHPDRFARGYDTRVTELAQKVFIEIRTVYDRAQHEEQNGTAHPSAPSQSVRMTGSSPAVTGSHVAVQPGVRKVSDILERVRARHAQNTDSYTSTTAAVAPASQQPAASRPAPAPAPVPGAGRGSSDFSKTSSGPVSRKTPTPSSATGIHAAVMSPDTLFRNAKRALVAGATAKALELVEQTMRAGLDTASVVAHEKYLRYALQEVAADVVLPDLQRALAGLEGNLPERAQVHVLIGHVYRTEELIDEAITSYTKAVSDDKLNEEANRWARYLRGRAERQEGGFFNRLLTSRLAITPGKK